MRQGYTPHERQILDLTRQIAALRLALDAATARAQSLSNELLDAMHARDNHHDRAKIMSRMLDTIEGVATGQPGEIPTTVEDGWSTALGPVLAVVRERDTAIAALRSIEDLIRVPGDPAPILVAVRALVALAMGEDR